MRRKEFLKTLGAAIGGLAVPRPASASALDMLVVGSGAGDDDRYWRLIRKQFVLEPGVAYLNFAGLGSCPLPVLNTLWEATRAEERAPAAGHDEAMWWGVKARLARLLGPTCRKEDLALIGCASEGINAIINGLPLTAADEVITSTHEHVSLNVALLNRARRDGVVVKVFEPDLARADKNVDRIAALTTPRTRLVFTSHVTCTTGQIMPAQAIAAFTRPRGIWFALDGAQAPVCVPFDITTCGADFYTSSTHKWVMGPKRTGFLYVREGLLEALRPTVAGSYSSDRYDLARGDLVLHPTAQRYEYGTQNDALFAALGTALDFVQAIGPARIWDHNRALAERFWREAPRITGLELLSPAESAHRSAIITFRTAGHPYLAVNRHLTSAGIRVRTVTEGGVDAIRVAFHVCNDDGDVDRLMAALETL